MDLGENRLTSYGGGGSNSDVPTPLEKYFKCRFLFFKIIFGPLKGYMCTLRNIRSSFRISYLKFSVEEKFFAFTRCCWRFLLTDIPPTTVVEFH